MVKNKIQVCNLLKNNRFCLRLFIVWGANSQKQCKQNQLKII